MGSDHRAVHARFAWPLMPKRRRAIENAKRCRNMLKPALWTEVDQDLYLEAATRLLNDLKTTNDIDEKCRQVEEALTEAARLSQRDRNSEHAGIVTSQRCDLHDWIEQRSQTPHQNTTERRWLSKLIQREVKALKKVERRTKIQQRLNDIKGLKYISGVKTRQKHKYITHMTNADGTEVTDRTEIANVFANFYERLYATECQHGQHHTAAGDSTDFTPFTIEELRKELKSLKTIAAKIPHV